nr:heat-inducible transcriptional repressor HrcA [Ardenticatena sp.]
MYDELTERQRAILGLIVREYVATAQPVASKTLVEKYNLGVSSATVRNEMAALEQMGYLTHPHTSAGRMPTERGYRYFVQCLMEQSELPEEEQRLIRHQFHQAHMDLDQWMRLAAAVLAHTAHTASLVTVPQAPQARLKHIELINISEALVLVILVTSAGLVRQQMVPQPHPPLQQETLNAIANKLNALFEGMTYQEVRHRIGQDLTPFERSVANVAALLMERIDSRSVGQIYRDGLLHVLRQPEFAEAEAVRQLVEIIEGRTLLEHIIAEINNTSGVQVIIGGEQPWEAIGDVSLVVSPYGVDGYAAGIMGVLGPQRMPYGRAVSVVRFVSDLMSHLLASMYGGQPLTQTRREANYANQERLHCKKGGRGSAT